MQRRRFLALLGTAAPALWLDGMGLIQLPGKMIVAFSGKCSFCAKDAREVFGLAGVVGRSARVCNECLEISLEILRDDALLPQPPPAQALPAEVADAFDFEMTALRNPLMSLPEDVREWLRKLLDPSAAVPQRTSNNELACSFCAKNQHEVRKLIAGPQTYICDVCIGDAAALVKRHS